MTDDERLILISRMADICMSTHESARTRVDAAMAAFAVANGTRLDSPRWPDIIQGLLQIVQSTHEDAEDTVAACKAILAAGRVGASDEYVVAQARQRLLTARNHLNMEAIRLLPEDQMDEMEQMLESLTQQ